MGKANFTEDFKRDAVLQITERGYPHGADRHQAEGDEGREGDVAMTDRAAAGVIHRSRDKRDFGRDFGRDIAEGIIKPAEADPAPPRWRCTWREH